MGPPPRKSRGWLINGIAVASVAAVFGLSYFGNRMSSAGKAVDPFPAAEYRLTVPKNLLGDDYQLVTDNSAEADASAKKEADYTGPTWRTTAAVSGSYNGTGTDASRGLVLIGMYGQFNDPAEQRRRLLKGLREAEGMSEPNRPQTITPPGSDVELECSVLLSKDQNGTSTVPVCAWGDANTVAYVAFVTPADAVRILTPSTWMRPRGRS